MTGKEDYRKRRRTLLPLSCNARLQSGGSWIDDTMKCKWIGCHECKRENPGMGGCAGGEVHAEDKKRFSQFYTPNITIMLRMVHKNEN